MMNFYYDAVLGLCYSFEPCLVIIDFNQLPTPEDVEGFFERWRNQGIMMQNTTKAIHDVIIPENPITTNSIL